MSKLRRPSQSSAHPLTIEQILQWADAHHARTGKWPSINSGAIPAIPGVTWDMVYQALYCGFHGLPGGSSLARLLAEHRGVRNRVDSPLTVQQILQWADAHYRPKGKWPAMTSGKVIGCPGETWRDIDNALRRGSRGLPGGRSLSQLLHKQRGARSRNRKSRLTVAQILTWADAHYRRFKRWPDSTCGRVVRTLDESWQNIDAALNKGHRGLPSRSSLAKPLNTSRGHPPLL